MARPFCIVPLSACLLIFGSVPLLASGSAPEGDGRAYSVCEVLKNIEKLNGQVVTVRAVFGWTLRHGGGLAQEGLDPYVQPCPGIDRSKRKWPPALHIASPDSIGGPDGPVSFREQAPGYSDLIKTVQDHERKTGRDVVIATITGEIRTRKHVQIQRHGDDIVGNGYGQAGACPAVLIVKTIVAAEDPETHRPLSLSADQRGNREQ